MITLRDPYYIDLADNGDVMGVLPSASFRSLMSDLSNHYLNSAGRSYLPDRLPYPGKGALRIEPN